MKGDGEGRAAFGRAVERRLMDMGQTRGWLGAEVARIEQGPRATPYTQSAVSQWLSGQTEPSRSKVFAIEAALNCEPGTLSRLLGYLPLKAKAVRSVPEAIAADPALTDQGRRMLRALYDEAVST